MDISGNLLFSNKDFPLVPTVPVGTHIRTLRVPSFPSQRLNRRKASPLAFTRRPWQREKCFGVVESAESERTVIGWRRFVKAIWFATFDQAALFYFAPT